MYYNTTAETGSDLRVYREAAKTQEEAILLFFETHPGPWRPDDIQIYVFRNNTPLTSVRRAITNLTYAGKLAKTGIKRMGNMGRPVHTWVLAGRKTTKVKRQPAGMVQTTLF